LIEIGLAGYDYFQNFNFSDPVIKNEMLQYFSSLQSISDSLRMISEKELDNIPLTPGEIEFLKNMMFEVETYTGIEYDGWYPKLLYRDKEFQYESLLGRDHIVADIHTTPSDCEGAMYGWIKHVGTGRVDMGVFIAEIPGGDDCAFIGPMLSYHDYTTSDWLRLTDEEWRNEYLYSATRPDWVNVYLADTLGQSRGEGATLITSVTNEENNIIPQSQLLLSNYPNPFNPYTIIAFSIPYDMTNTAVELNIYDISGSLVKTLVKENLPAGNYLSKWNSDNEKGMKVSSGIYIYSLSVGERIVTRKMTYLK
jgi:hypothetical protein